MAYTSLEEVQGSIPCFSNLLIVSDSYHLPFCHLDDFSIPQSNSHTFFFVWILRVGLRTNFFAGYDIARLRFDKGARLAFSFLLTQASSPNHSHTDQGTSNQSADNRRGSMLLLSTGYDDGNDILMTMTADSSLTAGRIFRSTRIV